MGLLLFFFLSFFFFSFFFFSILLSILFRAGTFPVLNVTPRPERRQEQVQSCAAGPRPPIPPERGDKGGCPRARRLERRVRVSMKGHGVRCEIELGLQV